MHWYYGITSTIWLIWVFCFNCHISLCHCNGNENWITGVVQATGLDAWASRVKCPARFVSHLHEICLLAIWCLRPWWVRILSSAEEDNLSPFDSNIACLCQSIEINNNKHVYRQSQVRMPNGCGVEWAECSLIIGTGCRVQVFSLILDSSVGLSVGSQSAGDLVSETLMGSNPAFSRGRQLVSFRFEYRLPVPEHRN